jgi:cell fate regulator YaaT (PSP1 superfamily)
VAPLMRAAPEEYDEPAAETDGKYGDDSDAPTPEVTLAADLPVDGDDVDPATACGFDEGDAPGGPIANIVGVKFTMSGKIYLADAGDDSYQRGEEVLVDGERGVRIGTVAVGSVRRPHNHGRMDRVLRRPEERDRRAGREMERVAANALRAARDQVRRLGMHIRVFRCEPSQGGRKLRLYFASEDRVDARDLARELGRTLNARIELRQTGVRDQAKLVGGIGSCGMELCCSTWLPEFVPVSIKNAKDQGLVLNPTKVSGQCGRLKCCLVYEHATYAELRKGLPKLGKRVITELGEGRVVEVDVLRQRVRVSHVGGDVGYFEPHQVQPMFPSQGGPRGAPADDGEAEPDA